MKKWQNTISTMWTKNLIMLTMNGRPLNAIMSAVLHAGFILEELLEPMPTEEFKQALPQSYEKLLRKPQFLFIRARKSSER